MSWFWISCNLNCLCKVYINIACFIQSTTLREAFYNSDWYNNPPSTSKLINICMVRSEKPLMLTAGKFCVLSLNTFTSVSQWIIYIFKDILKPLILPFYVSTYNFCIRNTFFLFHRFENPFPGLKYTH